MPQTASLKRYIDELNDKASLNDIRLNEAVLPHGTVITVQCEKDRTVTLGIANGRGGIAYHSFEEGVSFECSPVFITKKTGFFSKLFEKLMA